MTNYPRIHGLEFCIEGSGFGRHEDDFERGADLIESRLRALPENELRALHAAIIAADGTDGIAEVGELERAGRAEATRGWRNAADVFVTLGANT